MLYRFFVRSSRTFAFFSFCSDKTMFCVEMSKTQQLYSYREHFEFYLYGLYQFDGLCQKPYPEFHIHFPWLKISPDLNYHPNFHFLQTEQFLFLNTVLPYCSSFSFLHSKTLTCLWKFFTCYCSSDTVDSSSSRFLISVLIASEISFVIYSFESLTNSSFSSLNFR